ncbi:hypothetical protein Nepgr_003204 [Nepenthes gracilis]|uniref:Uncharacterized protein n=1 Tax=Nepenthes gracilis TaxID=150966 RepID=A0AAD3XDG5_NEPGR|nr:hypothetical protein Nepgr_003204 [Nepenthes gracilis]
MHPMVVALVSVQFFPLEIHDDLLMYKARVPKSWGISTVAIRKSRDIQFCAAWAGLSLPVLVDSDNVVFLATKMRTSCKRTNLLMALHSFIIPTEICVENWPYRTCYSDVITSLRPAQYWVLTKYFKLYQNLELGIYQVL